VETSAGADCTFEDLVGDTGIFFARHFDQLPLLRRGALAGRAQELASVRQFDDLIAMEAVSPAYVRVAKDGRGVSSKAYTRTVGDNGTGLTEAVVPERVYELFRSGGTVSWNFLNHFLPSARHLVEVFTEALACPAEVVGFLTPAGRDGYAAHHDPVDVFVIQTEGMKDWRGWTPSSDRRGDSVHYTAEQLGEPALQTTLYPGDVLYLPYGTPHAAAAKEQVSLHLSVTVKPRRWRDLLLETVGELMRDEAFHAFPRLGGVGVRGAADDYAGKIAELRDLLAVVASADEIARLVATGRARGGADRPREFARLASMDTLTADTRLCRTPVPVELGPSDDGRTTVLVNGHRLAVPDAVAGRLRELEHGGSVPAGGLLAGVSQDRSVRAARQLTRLGVLQSVGGTGS